MSEWRALICPHCGGRIQAETKPGPEGETPNGFSCAGCSATWDVNGTPDDAATCQPRPDDDLRARQARMDSYVRDLFDLRLRAAGDCLQEGHQWQIDELRARAAEDKRFAVRDALLLAAADFDEFDHRGDNMTVVSWLRWRAFNWKAPQ